MLQIRDDGSVTEPNGLCIPGKGPHVNVVLKDFPSKQDIAKLLNKHSKVFEDIGRIRDNTNDTELFVKFNMKPDAAHVAQKPRPIAYYLQAPLKTWLEQGVADYIFEEVPNGEPVTWCSPLIFQPKPRFTDISKDGLQQNMYHALLISEYQTSTWKGTEYYKGLL